MQTALRFAQEGFQPLLTARSMDRLESMAHEICKRTGMDAKARVLDAAVSDQIHALAEEYGKDIQVLHYNAAVLRPQFLEQSTPESLAGDIQVDITGALVAVRAIAPFMRQRRSGSIFLTGGGLALFPSSEFLTLSIGKAGIRCMCQALFPELAKDGVHIASITVKKVVQASEGDPQRIADLFWKLQQQPRRAWTWEETYG
ncbi:MAG: SDR family NAD(P)-dependent oxidoreductase [Desulfovibrionaceae bacterium]|nr:SDR family NAD(P)-dependent oxidoreductase [Desulfovibrionaceae bacterium]